MYFKHSLKYFSHQIFNDKYTITQVGLQLVFSKYAFSVSKCDQKAIFCIKLQLLLLIYTSFL